MKHKFSKEDAQRIFALAAERQQTNAIEEQKLSLEDLEEAGLAAGIDPAFIRAAASDLLRPDRITGQRKFFGIPVEFRESHVLPIAFSEENWKRSIDIFSRVYDKPGKATEAGTTQRWASDENENHVPTVVIAEEDTEGRTRYTIERKIWPMVIGYGVGGGVNVFLGLLFTILSLTTASAAELLPAGLFMFAVGSIICLAGLVTTKYQIKKSLARFKDIFSGLERLANREEEHLSQSPQVLDTASSSMLDIDELAENEAALQQRSRKQTR